MCEQECCTDSDRYSTCHDVLTVDVDRDPTEDPKFTQEWIDA